MSDPLSEELLRYYIVHTMNYYEAYNSSLPLTMHKNGIHHELFHMHMPGHRVAP